MITLTDLTSAQVAMCERVWACKTMESFQAMLSQLTAADRQMAVTLMEIMVQESVEEELEAIDSYPLAEAVISRAKRG